MKIRILFGMILLAAMSRILPHPFNFTPIGAMAMFGAAYFERRWLGLIVPFFALFLSDLYINNVVYSAYYGGKFVWFTPGAWTIYGGFLAYFLLGQGLIRPKISIKNVVIASVSGSLIFFLLTNFGAWHNNPMYPQTAAGLGSAYFLGLPFLQNTILGDLCYSGILFGSFYFLKKQIPSLAH